MSSTSKEPAAKEKDSTAKELFQWLIAILAAVAIALFVDNFLIVNAQIYNCKRSGSVWFNGKHHHDRRSCGW